MRTIILCSIALLSACSSNQVKDGFGEAVDQYCQTDEAKRAGVLEVLQKGGSSQFVTTGLGCVPRAS